MPEQASDPTNHVLVAKCQVCGSFAILTWPEGGKYCRDCKAVWDGTHRGIVTPPLAAPLPRLR
jgi:hypothetical protein